MSTSGSVFRTQMYPNCQRTFPYSPGRWNSTRVWCLKFHHGGRIKDSLRRCQQTYPLVGVYCAFLDASGPISCVHALRREEVTYALSNAEEHEMEQVQFKRQGETETAAVRKPNQSETTQTHPGKRKHETPNRTFNSGSRDLQKTFLVRALATLQASEVLIGVCTY